MKKYKRLYLKVGSWIGIIPGVLIFMLYSILALFIGSWLLFMLALSLLFGILYNYLVLELLKETQGARR